MCVFAIGMSFLVRYPLRFFGSFFIRLFIFLIFRSFCVFWMVAPHQLYLFQYFLPVYGLSSVYFSRLISSTTQSFINQDPDQIVAMIHYSRLKSLMNLSVSPTTKLCAPWVQGKCHSLSHLHLTLVDTWIENVVNGLLIFDCDSCLLEESLISDILFIVGINKALPLTQLSRESG